MPSFNQLNDFYLASGTAQLLNSWVDPVYKFDSSSFYNWEQDNLPIYDLEDRTNLTYEMAGWPTSAVDGVMLTVSSTGVDNKKVFSSIADAVDALPNTIRCPIIIEVCTSGQLGGMHLEHKNFEGSGAGLEIINRGFAKALCGSGGTISASALPILTEVGGAVPTDGSSMLMMRSTSLSDAMYESSSIGVSTTVWDGNTAIDWWNNFTRAFALYPEWGNEHSTSERTITMSTNFGDGNTAWSFPSQVSANCFQMAPYADNSLSSDIVITNPGNDDNVQRDNLICGNNPSNSTVARATGLVYANCLSGVTVKGCSGKIYIRGFCVDGATQASLASTGSQRADIGFDIQESEVLLENCAVTRCKHAGLEAVNSNVTLNRGFIAHHNYELQDGGSHLSEKVLLNATAGLRAINSNITLSASTENLYGLPIDSPYCFYRNIKGIVLENSNLRTPEVMTYGRDSAGTLRSNAYGPQSIALQTFFNMEEGILAKESLIRTGQRISSFQNNIGISLDNTVCELSELTVDHNQNEGVKCNNSTLNYNSTPDASGSSGGFRWTGGPWFPSTNFTDNGQHIVLNSSRMIPTDVINMPTKYSRFSLTNNFGVTTRGGVSTTVPAVVLDNGSYMKAVSTKSICGDAVTNGDSYLASYSAIRGSAFRVVSSSRLDLYGTGPDATWILGPVSWYKQQYNSALYAGNNSHILIAGPTTICQIGIDALAEDNSTIEIGPHMDKEGLIDTSGYVLENAVSPSNQTQVQLHSTRASLVANKNSTLDIHDVGDYHAHWNSKYLTGSQDYATGTTNRAFNTSSVCASGWLQFYPNPFINYSTYNVVPQATYPTATNFVDHTNTRQISQSIFPFVEATMTDASIGGMCVRAVGDSQVNVKNVTFPAGWTNTFGPYYDVSTVGECDQLRIWNIADNSELHASYLSVGNNAQTGGAKHPQDVSAYYYGPSAMWVSGALQTPLSGAPSSTPDTSTLSVLDSFGVGVNTGAGLGVYGKTNPENIGPFRLYVSPHPKTKYLGYVDGGSTGFYTPGIPNVDPFFSMGYNMPSHATLKTGAPYQLIAQGYATSSDCSATNDQGNNYTNPSSIYQELGFSAYIDSLPADQRSENVASSFPYVSGLVPADSASRIWLDESAINTFANAKNGLLGTSGRKKLFSYYKAIAGYPGEGFYQATVGFGLGLGSASLFDIDREL